MEGLNILLSEEVEMEIFHAASIPKNAFLFWENHCVCKTLCQVVDKKINIPHACRFETIYKCKQHNFYTDISAALFYHQK
jgi:hypothetical protein